MEYDISLGCYFDAARRLHSTLALQGPTNTVVAKLDVDMVKASIDSDVIKLSSYFTFRPSRHNIYINNPDGNVTIGLHVNTSADLLSILREKFTKSPVSLTS